MNGLLGRFGFKVDELRLYAGGDGVINGSVQEDDAFLICESKHVRCGRHFGMIRTMSSREKMSSGIPLLVDAYRTAWAE